MSSRKQTKGNAAMKTFTQLFGSTVLAVGLAVLGFGFIEMSSTALKFLPELAATRKDVKDLQTYIDTLTNKAPAIAGSTGEAAGKGLVKGTVDGAKAEALKAAINPASVVADPVVAALPKAAQPVANVVLNPVGAALGAVGIHF
jgi:hypothetical protein